MGKGKLSNFIYKKMVYYLIIIYFLLLKIGLFLQLEYSENYKHGQKFQ